MKTRDIALLMLVSLGCLVLVSGCTLFRTTQAVITVTAEAGIVPLTVSYDGNASVGVDGISTYHWTFGTGAESYEVGGTYTYRHAGTFDLTLTVRGENGKTDTASVQIEVLPAVWVCDENLQQVFKLDMEGDVVATHDVPVADPRGVTVAEVAGADWLFVACYGGGNQRILQMDPASGAVSAEYTAPAGAPLYLSYAAQEPMRLWHVDGLSRRIYEMNPANGQVIGAFGTNYFRSSGQVGGEVFLQTPMGIDWTEEPASSGFVWYLEGETRWLYQFDVDAPINIFEGVQLMAVGEPVEVDASVFPVAGMDIYDGRLWVVDRDHHEIVQIDLDTGLPTGARVSGFPGAAVSGLEIQH
ncbi:PKD domain-containing protein [Candidatus Bipolaricaulota bacterium]|nr:PKD domain-containing protein [Candidatus Bipolaricaulota bacterium]